MAGPLAAAAMAGSWVAVLLVLGILLLLPRSELAVQAVNYLVTRLLSPGVLPKMSSRRRASRTIVAPWSSCRCC
jgi:hypothetical protein